MEQTQELTNAVATMTPAPKYLAKRYTYSGSLRRGNHFARTGNIVAAEETIRMTKIDEILTPRCPLYSFPEFARVRAHITSRSLAVVRSTCLGSKAPVVVVAAAAAAETLKNAMLEVGKEISGCMTS